MIALEPDGYCPRCRENVTPLRGLCPWCDTEVEDLFGHEKGYCPVCDLMVDRANNGRCWRCGTVCQRGAPWDACGCGCGEQIRRFDEHGRRVRWVRGHAPRSLEQDGQVPVEPFAAYLERRLRELDLIAALAREHGISRELVVAVLRRDESTVSRAKVRHALWVFGQNGKGMPRRPDSVGFFELYPDDKRARTCPGCGKGKAPHAELCKRCRIERNRRNGRPVQGQPTRIGEHVLQAAYRAYIDENLTFRALGERFIDRVPHTSAEGLSQAFAKQFRKKGWPVRQRTTRKRG